MIERVRELRRDRPIFIADFWNNGEYTGGCIAGGKQYFHINAAGEVEPCAFVHFAVDNIKNKSLKDVLQNRFFKAYQRKQPFNENHLAPCPIIDAPASLRNMVSECRAYPTHTGAEHVLQGEVAEKLDLLSGRWLALADAFKAAENEREGNQEARSTKQEVPDGKVKPVKPCYPWFLKVDGAFLSGWGNKTAGGNIDVKYLQSGHTFHLVFNFKLKIFKQAREEVVGSVCQGNIQVNDHSLTAVGDGYFVATGNSRHPFRFISSYLLQDMLRDVIASQGTVKGTDNRLLSLMYAGGLILPAA